MAPPKNLQSDNGGNGAKRKRVEGEAKNSDKGKRKFVCSETLAMIEELKRMTYEELREKMVILTREINEQKELVRSYEDELVKSDNLEGIIDTKIEERRETRSDSSSGSETGQRTGEVYNEYPELPDNLPPEEYQIGKHIEFPDYTDLEKGHKDYIFGCSAHLADELEEESKENIILTKNLAEAEERVRELSAELELHRKAYLAKIDNIP